MCFLSMKERWAALFDRGKCSWWSGRKLYGVKQGDMDCWECLFAMLGVLQQRESRGWFDSYDDPMFRTPHSETTTLVYRAELRVELM